MQLRMSAPELRDLHTGLLSSAPEEGAAFLSVEPSGNRLVVRSSRLFERSELDGGEWGELSLTEAAQMAGLAAIKRGGHGLVEVHTHPAAIDDVAFSSFDNDQLPRFARYVRNKLPGRPFGALVFGPNSYDGRVLAGTGFEAMTLNAVGERAAVPAWATQTCRQEGFDDRFDRQVRALGPEGQRALAALNIGVVGLGGTGSVVVQQLAHLGVGGLVLVDDDRVESSNLSRLAGGTWWDATLHRRKSSVARRQVHRVRPGASVRLSGKLQSHEALARLREVDLIIGCVDNDGARLVLTELAAAHLVPYIDVGVGIEQEESQPVFGGRIAFYLPGGPCLACADELDFGEAAEDLESASLHALRAQRGYARDRRVEPALMPLNTVLAGLAITEMLSFVTGVRSVAPFNRYDLIEQRLVRLNVLKDDDCVVCAPAYGMGDRQAIERYALEE